MLIGSTHRTWRLPERPSSAAGAWESCSLPGCRPNSGRSLTWRGAFEPRRRPLEQEVARLSRRLAAIAFVVGTAFFAFGVVLGRGFWQNFLFALGIIVALVPEGLLPTVTLSLASAARRMAARKVLVRTLSAVETLGCATVICTDKTGTLTRNVMAVRRLWIEGEWFDAGTEAAWHSPPIRFFRAAVLASDAEVSRSGQWTGDPDRNGARRGGGERHRSRSRENREPKDRRNPVRFRPEDDDDPQPTAGRKAGGLPQGRARSRGRAVRSVGGQGRGTAR